MATDVRGALGRLGAAAAVAVMCAGAGTRAASDPSVTSFNAIPTLHVVLFGQSRYLVSDAILGAIRRLAEPRCGSLLTYFRDEQGRMLADNLEKSGRSARDYLSDLRFAEGTGMEQCDVGHIVAATQPGSHVVFICSLQFERQFRPDPHSAQMIVIHEFLHSLGLGENPPTSKQITETVTARCGD